MYTPVSQQEADSWLESQRGALLHEVHGDLGIEDHDATEYLSRLREGDMRVYTEPQEVPIEEKKRRTAIAAFYLEQFQLQFRQVTAGPDLGLEPGELRQLDRVAKQSNYSDMVALISKTALNVASRCYVVQNNALQDSGSGQALSHSVRNTESASVSNRTWNSARDRETIMQKIGLGQQNAYLELHMLARMSPFAIGEVEHNVPENYYNTQLIPPNELRVLPKSHYVLQRFEYRSESMDRESLSTILRQGLLHVRDVAHCEMDVFSVYELLRFREIMTDSKSSGFMGISNGARERLVSLCPLITEATVEDPELDSITFNQHAVKCPAEYTALPAKSDGYPTNLIVDQFNHFQAMIDRWLLENIDGIWERS